jgi:DNA-binding response OmpR family regulator
MAPPTKRRASPVRRRIWIADSRPADYDCLKSGSDAAQMDVRFLASAGDVLRRWSTDMPDVCLVNVRLSGMSGFDLIEMLRPFPEGMTVGIVDDRYAVEDEVRALGLGVHHYFCKPLEGAVLSDFCTRRKLERRCYR